MRQKVAEGNAAKWCDEQFRLKCSRANASNGSYRHSQQHKQRGSAALRLKWLDDNYRVKQLKLRSDTGFLGHISNGLRRKWEDCDYREKMALARSLAPKVSSIQMKLYSILDGLGVRYFREYNDRVDDRECIIGYYSFDCRIPRQGQPDLLIEVQGDYWHSLPDAVIRDRRKRSYVRNNTAFELEYIWEHEFLNIGKIVDTIKTWLNLNQLEVLQC
jgi:hypothetical protein